MINYIEATCYGSWSGWVVGWRNLKYILKLTLTSSCHFMFSLQQIQWLHLFSSSSSSHISKPHANTWRKVTLHKPPFWMISVTLSLARATSLNKMQFLLLLLFFFSLCSCQQQNPPPLLEDDAIINDMVSESGGFIGLHPETELVSEQPPGSGM